MPTRFVLRLYRYMFFGNVRCILSCQLKKLPFWIPTEILKQIKPLTSPTVQGWPFGQTAKNRANPKQWEHEPFLSKHHNSLIQMQCSYGQAEQHLQYQCTGPRAWCATASMSSGIVGMKAVCRVNIPMIYNRTLTGLKTSKQTNHMTASEEHESGTGRQVGGAQEHACILRVDRG